MVSTVFIPARDHLALGRRFFNLVRPAEFPRAKPRYRNLAWAERLGLGALDGDDDAWISKFARFEPFEGSLRRPIALAYHGHQFGVYNPDIGDGRGFLYAQMRDPVDGRLLDFGTKGSGRTPYSRGADGRLTLKGAVREALATEMLDALGVETSKTFSVIETFEALERHDEPSPTRSAVLVRLSFGHIRIGSFQRLAFLGWQDSVEKLLRHSARTYYPDRLDASAPVADLAVDFVAAVAGELARLAASWMAAGFVHGVLNTDNFNITGESFDYGPWRFLPRLEPGFTAAYFDHAGRYAYGRQPEATFWALCRLAESFSGLADAEGLERAVGVFGGAVDGETVAAFCRRLGIDPDWEEAGGMVEEMLKAMRAGGHGFEEVVFDWFGGRGDRAMEGKRADRYRDIGFKDAAALLRAAPAASGLALDHPYFGRGDPVTMLIDEMEALWEPIVRDDDWGRLAAAAADIQMMGEAYGLRRVRPGIRVG